MQSLFMAAGGVRSSIAIAEEEEDIGSVSSFSDDDDGGGGASEKEAAPFEMSSMLSQLPVKKGLSLYFDGKSQSFTSLAAVQSVADLAKPPRSQRRRMRTSRSYGNGLDARKHLLPRHSPMAFAKKSSASVAGENRRRTAMAKMHERHPAHAVVLA